MPIRFKRLPSFFLVLLLFVLAECRAGQAAPQSSAQPAATTGDVYLDASSFAAELQRIGNDVQKEKATPAGLAAVREALPPHWEVTTGEVRYTISADPLRNLLREAEKEKKPESMAKKAGDAASWAQDLANQVQAYAGAQADNTKNARPALDRILSRREFGNVHGPTAWDLLRQRISRWIQNMLLRFFRQVGQYPIGARILFWFIVIAVVVWLAMVLFRYWTRRATLEELRAPDIVAYVRTWQEWVQAAREAAARGDFREAIHCAYWAGISYLEDSEVVRKDRSRTPREYVRLVANSTQFVSTGPKRREALSALTMVLEQVWYGRRPASSQDFANAMQSVEALGCQLQ